VICTHSYLNKQTFFHLKTLKIDFSQDLYLIYYSSRTEFEYYHSYSEQHNVHSMTEASLSGCSRLILVEAQRHWGGIQYIPSTYSFINESQDRIFKMLKLGSVTTLPLEWLGSDFCIIIDYDILSLEKSSAAMDIWLKRLQQLSITKDPWLS